mgnify:CR=1 FL=1
MITFSLECDDNSLIEQQGLIKIGAKKVNSTRLLNQIYKSLK